MASLRSAVVVEGEVGAYHCMARCVRRAALCGIDALTQRSFDYRKDWLRQRLEQLAPAFAIDIGGYAIMSNHLHVVLKTRPDIASRWEPAEVTQQWRLIFPHRRQPKAVIQAINEKETADKKLVAIRRARLSSVSWFMRCLLEKIARRANAEDQCTGRFWEERFKCVGLLDEPAILACTTYVDLNPVRAGLVQTPEQSTFTSVYDRIKQRQENRPGLLAADGWLSPILHLERKSKTSRRISQTPWLEMELDQYLELLDWTGRQLREDKKGAIPPHLAPILERLKIRPDGWMLAAKNFGVLFPRFAGAADKLTKRAKARKRKTVRGVAAAKEVFG